MKSKITVIPEIANTPILYKIDWLSLNTMLLQLTQEKGPQGQLLTFKIDSIPTIIPFIKKSVQGSVRPYTPIELSQDTIINNVPSCGPLLLTFNTPVDPTNLKKSIILLFRDILRPLSFPPTVRITQIIAAGTISPKNLLRMEQLTKSLLNRV